MIDQKLCQELHAELLRDRERLKGELAGMEQSHSISGELFDADMQDSVDQHPADEGSEMFEREKNLTIRRTREIQVADIDAALQKFEDGTYGICEICGKPIPEARLRAYPAATHDVECQSRLEHQGHAVGSRVG
jgi:RNA polymerase-binding transcription factor DksA